MRNFSINDISIFNKINEKILIVYGIKYIIRMLVHNEPSESSNSVITNTIFETPCFAQLVTGHFIYVTLIENA